MNNATDHSATLLEFLKGKLPFRLRLILPLAAAAVALAALFIYPAYAQDGDEPLTDRPYDLHAVAGDGAVTLTWKDPEIHQSHTRVVVLRHRPELGETEPQVHGSYVVAERVDGGRRYVDRDVEPGVLYVYAVQAVKDFFGYLTEASASVEVRMPAAQEEVQEATPESRRLSQLPSCVPLRSCPACGTGEAGGAAGPSFSSSTDS